MNGEINTNILEDLPAIIGSKIPLLILKVMGVKMRNKISRQSKIKVLLCFTYLMLIIFYHHIDKYLNGPVYLILTLLIPICFIAICTYVAQGIINSIRHRNNLSTEYYISTIVCLFTLCYSVLSPYRLDSQSLESDIEFQACYEGTQNQSTVKFRKDKSFELHSTGAFFANTWYTGQWNRIGDTIHLKYDNKKSERFGDLLLIKDGYLHNIGKSAKIMKVNIPHFYLGYCKHEN